MPAFTENDCRIDDEFYRTLMAMHRKRAADRADTGTALLVATCVLVLVGVAVFVFAAPEGKLSTENEAAYIADLSKLRDDKRQLSIESQRPVETHTVAKRTLELAELLDRVRTTWQQVITSKNRAFLDDLKNSAAFAGDVAESFGSPRSEPEQKAFMLKTSQGDRQFSYGQKSQDAFLQLAQANALNLPGLATEVSGVLALLKEGVPAGDELPQPFVDKLNAAYIDARNTARLETIKAKAKDKFKAAEANLEASKEDAIATQAALEKMDSDVKEVELKLEAEKEKRNAILFMAWVPGLTVRVGSVILLLFLTQVLLATYRFTMSLSTFYNGIGDAIQMLQPGAATDKWYRIEHLQLLMQMLIPGSVRIDPVVDPSQHLSDLAKAWIARGTK
jgi:hypothetical protein